MNSTRYYGFQSKEATSGDRIKVLLKNPQDWSNFKDLLSFVNFYIDYDSMCSGAVKNILIPFSQTRYNLVGSTKKNRAIFEQILIKNNFEDILQGIAHDYWYFGQSYIYLNDDGTMQVLPPFRCLVEGLSVGGEPIVSYELEKTATRSQTDIESLLRKYKGHPPEVEKALKAGGQYAQLSIGKTFRVAYSKASWERYALPLLTSALPWLLRKDALNKTFETELKNMRRTFLEIRVGDKDSLPIPNDTELMYAAAAYNNAISSDGNAAAVVSWNVLSDWKSVSSKDTMKYLEDSITQANWNILSAISMSPQLAAGDSSPNKAASNSFSATQASVAIINKRINAFLNDVTKMMNKIFRIIAENNGMKTAPEIYFDIVDLNENEELTEQMLLLYDKGLLSKETLFNNTQFSYEEELEKRKLELSSGAEEIFLPPLQAYNMSSGEPGRPTIDPMEKKIDDAGKNELPSPSDGG